MYLLSDFPENMDFLHNKRVHHTSSLVPDFVGTLVFASIETDVIIIIKLTVPVTYMDISWILTIVSYRTS